MAVEVVSELWLVSKVQQELDTDGLNTATTRNHRNVGCTTMLSPESFSYEFE